MSLTLSTLAESGVLRPIDHQLAKSLTRMGEESDPLISVAIAAASLQLGRGHVCADLPRLASQPVRDDQGAPIDDLCWPDLTAWTTALRGSTLVGDAPRPLVLDAADRLYLSRMKRFEDTLAADLLGRIRAPAPQIDPTALRTQLSSLFPNPPPPGQRTDWQRVAALTSVLQRFSVISGGPGTGKTSTVVKVLALLVGQQRALGGAPLRIRLLAPTGKAAARLVESIQKAKARLGLPDDIAALIPNQASTIHRGMGVLWGPIPRFRHGPDHPLPADVVLVDEASMVDLALMSRLISAVPPAARLILLGDQDQLASVEAGAILGDICNTGRRQGPSQPLIDRATALAGEAPPRGALTPAQVGPWDAVTQLTHSYRFDGTAGIGRLARAVRDGDSAAAIEILSDRGTPEVQLHPSPPNNHLGSTLRDEVVRGFTGAMRARDPHVRLRQLERYRVLCAHRRGPGGVNLLNPLIERALGRAGLIVPTTEWYDGRPIMIRANDYRLGLFNGDIGVVCRGPNGELRACFDDGEGGVRSLSPARLPAHHTVYAMTVHKSQGSEFEHVTIVLPGVQSPVLSRELVYTALTRARSAAVIYSDPDLLSDALHRPIQRASGLRAQLWGPPSGA